MEEGATRIVMDDGSTKLPQESNNSNAAARRSFIKAEGEREREREQERDLSVGLAF